jgi:phosphate uptake regulator
MSKMSKMETRKVQVTGGGSSYIITLPKKWVDNHKIGKNDPVGLIEQPDGTLLLTTKKLGEQTYRKKTFDITDIRDSAYLFRLLIGAYMMGFSIFEINSKKRIDPVLRGVIERFTQATIGPEVMEESIDSVTIKDLIDPKEMPFSKTLGRMYILVKSMHEEALAALRKEDRDLAQQVISRDSLVDRLHWLIARQVNIVARDTVLMKDMGITPEQTLHFFIISRILERIGDHAVKIAENIPIIIEKGLEKVLVEKITAASNLALEILSESYEALAKKDIKMANETFESIKQLIRQCEDIHNDAIQLKGEPPIAVSYIIESIRRTGEYAVDISEVIINLLVVS